MSVVLGIAIVVALPIVVTDLLSARGWASDERGTDAAPVSRSSGAPRFRICRHCRRPHPAELMPVELLLAGGVAVNVGRWFGGRVNRKEER